MKTILTALAAVAAVTAAVPAAAQSYGNAYGHDRDRYEQGRYEQGRQEHGRWDNDARYNVNQRQERLDRAIEQGLRNHSLTRQEARRLREQSQDIARLEARYRVGGLSNWERADLDRRFDALQNRIRIERNDRDYGYGYRR